MLGFHQRPEAYGLHYTQRLNFLEVSEKFLLSYSFLPAAGRHYVVLASLGQLQEVGEG
jgi:hypothetical protein